MKMYTFAFLYLEDIDATSLRELDRFVQTIVAFATPHISFDNRQSLDLLQFLIIIASIA
jgi:hypothetical protein